MWVTFPPFLSHSLHPTLHLVSWPGYVGSGIYTPVLAFDKMSHFSFFFLLAAFPSCSFHMDTSSPSESGSEIHFQGESRTLDMCPEMGHWAFPHPCPTVTFAALDFLSLCASQLCFSSLGICLLFFVNPLSVFFIMLQVGHPFSELVYVFENKCRRNHCLQVHKMKQR